MLSRDIAFSPPGVTVLRDLHVLPENCFIIGGAELYAQLLDRCSTAYITKLHTAAPQADAHFPNLDALPHWRLATASEPLEEQGLWMTFCVYENLTLPISPKIPIPV